MVIDILRNKKIKMLFNLFSLSLIIFALILSILSSLSAISLQQNKLVFLEEEEIIREDFSVNIEQNIKIKGVLYIKSELKKETASNVPTILLIHGINTRKEGNFHIVYQLVKRGYAVFSTEQRGHGESGGLVTFIDKEPSDMQKVIDYIDNNYDFANASHMGVVGLSYGGGVATVLQALDDRVYASAIYHPLSSVNRFLERIPVQNLVGKTAEINKFEGIKDGFSACSQENTENMLLLHGSEDDVILPEDSKDLYQQVDGNNRDDIGLEIRPGLGHGGNEHDETSLKYAIVWFEHFFHDPTINITNRDEEIKNISLYENNLPNTSKHEDILFFGMILLACGLFFLIIPRLHFIKENERTRNVGSRSMDESIEKDRYRNIFLKRLITYIGIAVILPPILALVNPSYIYGYFLIIPIITIGFLALIPHPKYQNALEEWREWSHKQLKFSILSSLVILLPLILFVLLFNFNAQIAYRSPIPFFNSTSFIYLTVGFSTVFVDYYLIRGWEFKHSFFLLIIRPVSLLIFFLFIPLPAFPEYGGMMIHYIILFTIGLICWLIQVLLFLSDKVLTSKFTATAIVLFPLCLFLVNRFFRMF